MNYYNEIDEYARQWLMNLMVEGLIPEGEVDGRDIRDVRAVDLKGYTQCHFFAGIGGWPLALKMAGWPSDRPVWTGSCPCQPFSQSGKQKGDKDERHLWPEFYRLIKERKPPTVFGEQVASAAGRQWFATVRTDLEACLYAVGGVDLPAAGIAAPHKRQRIFWVGDSDPSRLHIDMDRSEDWRESGWVCAEEDGPSREPGAFYRGVGDCDGSGSQQGCEATKRAGQGDSIDTTGAELGKHYTETPSCVVWCIDGKQRLAPLPESGFFPLAYGFPRKLGDLRTAPRYVGAVADFDERDLKSARACRRESLKCYGNAIVPQVAAVFVKAMM